MATTFVAPAFAQAPAANPPAEESAAPAAAAPAPPAPEPLPPAPPPPPPAAPAAPPSEFPPVTIGIWGRSAVAITGETDPEKLDDIGYETNLAELNFAGQIHKNVRMATNIIANGINGTMGVLDAWIGFGFAEEANLWVGQLLIPVDRANKAGPFFSIPWNFAQGGFTVGGTTVNVGPVRGRGLGGVFWGDLMGGKLKYLLGSFLDANVATHPLFSGRVTYSILGKERVGFGQSATYYGTLDEDVLSLSLGGQYRQDGSVGAAAAGGMPPAPDDYTNLSADLFAEFKLGGGSFVTAEADYWHYTGDNQPAKDQFSVMAAYATGDLGIGQLQPMVRYQMAMANEGDGQLSAIDVQLGLLIRQQKLRLLANFQHTSLTDIGTEDLSANKIQLALQAMY